MEGCIIEGDFISQFHKIQGDLISERKKNLYKLLRNPSIPVNDEVIKKLCPTTYLESLFKIDVLIYHKKTAELMEILKEGNESFVRKILKQPWFFQEALRTMKTNEIVNEFFPCLSYTLRTKMLKKLAIAFQEHQMDEIFNCLFERYGLSFATKILQCCTIKKIKEVLASYEVELSPKQLELIFDKDQDLFVKYLGFYKNLKRRHYNHKTLCKYVALQNPKLWIELQEGEKISACTVGRRRSKNIMKLLKDEVTEDISKYSNFLNNDVIVHELREKFNDIYFRLFPRNVEDIKMSNFCNVLMRYYPKTRQWDLFANTFFQVFEKDILDNLNCLDCSFVCLFPEKNITHKWAQIKYGLTNEDYLLKFCEPNEAISLIKQKISVTSDIYKRKELVFLLLENCAQNKDLISLMPVLKYIFFHHINEDINFHNNLLTKLSNLFELQDFNETHWNYINEEIALLKARNEFNFFTHNRLLERYLEHLFVNGKPYKNEIEHYITSIAERFHHDITFRFNLDNPPVEKEILIEVINTFPEVVPKDHLHFKDFKIILINDIINFSKRYPEYSINLQVFPSLVSYIKSISDQNDLNSTDCGLLNNILPYSINFPEKRLIEKSTIKQIFLNNKKNNSWFQNIWEILILKKERTDFENELVHTYFNDIFDHWICPEIVQWFIRNEPRTVIPYFDKIVENSLDYNLINCSRMRLMSHLDFDKKVIDFYIKQLCPKQNVEHIIQRLSVLLPTEDFIKIVVEPHLPVQEKLDVDDQDRLKAYSLQCRVAQNLKKVNEPAKMLPIVMKFSVGDYLQCSLQSLYSIFYRSPEKLLYNYIFILSERAASTRKHAFYLSCNLLNYSYVTNMIKTIEEENISSQKYIFSATVKYFVKSQSEELFNLVILNLNRIDENDDETLGKLVKIKIPSKYLPRYIEKCWQYYESIRKKEVNIADYLHSILVRLTRRNTDLVPFLTREFCVHVIDNFFKEQKNEILSGKIESFVCKFLKDRKTERAENFKYAFQVLSILKANKRCDDISTFFEISYQNISDDKDDLDFFQRFSDNWFVLFSPREKFGNYLSLKLLKLQVESSKENFVQDYAQRVVMFLDELVLKYGQLVYEKFRSYLIKTLNFTLKDKYVFLLNMLKCNISTITCSLVFDLITPPSSAEKEDVVSVYNEILEILKKVNDPLIKVYAECYFF